MTLDRDNIRFNALRNALYHTARRRSFEAWNRVFNFLVVILGTAAVSDLLTTTPIDPRWIGGAVATIGALQLVFDFGSKARDHQLLQRDYYQVLADIEATVDPTSQDLAKWSSELTRITADEPPTLRAMDAKAYNDAIGATEVYPPSERLRIPLWHRVFGGILPFDGYHYRKISEVKA